MRLAPDAELIEHVRAADDRRAFAELVRRHQAGVRGLLRRLCDDPAEADDLAQDTFFQAYRALPGFRGEARLSTWLYRIAYHRFLAHHRRRGGAVVDDAVPVEALPDTAAPVAGQAAMKVDLSRALARLPLAQRAAIVQVYYEDLTYEEAAFVLDCPVGTVKTNVHRGRQALQRLLSAWAPR